MRKLILLAVAILVLIAIGYWARFVQDGMESIVPKLVPEDRFSAVIGSSCPPAEPRGVPLLKALSRVVLSWNPNIDMGAGLGLPLDYQSPKWCFLRFGSDLFTGDAVVHELAPARVQVDVYLKTDQSLLQSTRPTFSIVALAQGQNVYVFDSLRYHLTVLRGVNDDVPPEPRARTDAKP